MKHYHVALELQPEFLEANVKMGTHHLMCGRWDQAADAFHNAAELNDKAMLSYVGLGVAQAASGELGQAMNSFDLAASIEPNTSLLMTEMARLQLKAAVADEFLKSFQTDDEPGPQSDVSLDNDDLLHMQIERHAAEVARRPRHADVRYRYGVLLRAEDRTGEAMEQFRLATEINPTYVQALVKLGICRQELGQSEQAIEAFNRVLDIKSEYVDMHYRLGLLYTDRRQFDLAVQEMEAASEGAPDNTQIRAALALSLQNMGLMDRAAATWRSLWQMHQAANKT
jgi:Flp pilus assembly protein TadD